MLAFDYDFRFDFKIDFVGIFFVFIVMLVHGGFKKSRETTSDSFRSLIEGTPSTQFLDSLRRFWSHSVVSLRKNGYLRLTLQLIKGQKPYRVKTMVLGSLGTEQRRLKVEISPFSRSATSMTKWPSMSTMILDVVFIPFQMTAKQFLILVFYAAFSEKLLLGKL